MRRTIRIEDQNKNEEKRGKRKKKEKRGKKDEKGEKKKEESELGTEFIANSRCCKYIQILI